MSTPAKLGRYDVVGHLASGGMAEIFLGRLRGPRGFEHPVVIKRVLPGLERSKEFVDMFVDEANIVAAIRHPNVVTVHELGHDGDDLFLVMEYLEGESIGSLLRRLWSRGESLDRCLGAHVIAEACAGLHAAHELIDENGDPRELVHRDVSPQNVVVTYDGAVKVLDFGIAKAAKRHTKTEAGQIKGKLGYMSPEQAHGKPLDRRSDIFALGTLLYELTTSTRLFRRASDLETLKAITEEPVVPPSLVDREYPRSIEAICLRSLEKRRDARYATAAEMRRDLVAAIAGLKGPALPEEELAAVMRRVFADRIAEKAEMLRRVRAGTDVSELPGAETDEAVDIPAVDRSITRSTFAAPSEAAPTRRRSAKVAAGGALVLSAIAAASVAISSRTRPSDVATAPIASASAAASASSASPDVGIRLESVPPGARLVMDGAERGVTPIDVRVPRGDASISLELHRDGFADWKQDVVPAKDQTLVVNLQPHPRPAASTPKASTRVAPPLPAIPDTISTSAGAPSAAAPSSARPPPPTYDKL